MNKDWLTDDIAIIDGKGYGIALGGNQVCLGYVKDIKRKLAEGKTVPQLIAEIATRSSQSSVEGL